MGQLPPFVENLAIEVNVFTDTRIPVVNLKQRGLNPPLPSTWPSMALRAMVEFKARRWRWRWQQDSLVVVSILVMVLGTVATPIMLAVNDAPCNCQQRDQTA